MTTTANIELPDVKLGKKTKPRKKKKMSKINITEKLITVVSESQKDILSLSVLKLQGKLTEEAIKDQLESTVLEVQAELQKAVDAEDEAVVLEVNWAEVLEHLQEDTSKFTETFNKVQAVLEKIEGVDEATAKESVELFALALSHSAESIFESFESEVSDEVEKQLEELSESQEKEIETRYMEATQEWIAEKKELIEAGEKAVRVDELYAALKNLCVEYNISFDEESSDKISNLEEANKDLENKLADQTEKAKELQEKINSAAKEKVLADVSEGLSDVDKNKLAELSEPVVFIDEEQFAKKVTELKESFIDSSVKPKKDLEPEAVDESVEDEEEDKPTFASIFETFNK